ncbi:MAG: hypothetical protein FWD35_02330, partial [Oscillospiraceae bacterium]|nr:hypothetical protein [Oscillospiraceae bacterium]
PTPPTKPEIPAAEEKFSSKENIVIVPSDAAAASPAPTHKSKNKIYAIAGAAAALVLLVVGIAVISALRGDGPPVESQSPPSSEATPEITEPTSANGSLMTSPATSTGGEATEPSVSPVTEPPSDTEAAPDTPDTPPSASVASGTATTTRATTTAATVLTLPTTTATTRVLTTAVTTRTNPTTVATTRPTTPTTVPTTAPTTATTARRPVETRIFDMQTDPNLARFAGLGSSAQSTHALLGSHGADRVVDTTSTPRTIAITRRGGGSQGVFINLDQITLTPNATYRFDFSGSVTSATGTHTIDFTSVTDTSGRGSDVATLRSVTTSANGSFTLTHSLTQYDISVMHARGVRRLRLGGASGQDLLITGILIREVV